MTKITALDLSPFYRNSIGVDRLFGRIMDQIDHASTNNYPPYNILGYMHMNIKASVLDVSFAHLHWLIMWK
jgi:hypothetical protein